MFQLALKIDGIEKTMNSASQQSLIREVIDLFDSKDMEVCPIPWDCEINARGQIVEMYFENEPEDVWWKQNHPVRGPHQVKIEGRISKQTATSNEERYEIPADLLDGDGKCWVAMKEKKVVDVVYNRVKHGESLHEFKTKAFTRLEKSGKILEGLITAKCFVPKLNK